MLTVMIFASVPSPVALKRRIHPVNSGLIMVLGLMIGWPMPLVGRVIDVLTRVAKDLFEKSAKAGASWLIPILLILAFITLVPEMVRICPAP